MLGLEPIPHYDEPPSYKEFLEKHMTPNRPAVIGSKLSEHWPCQKDWVIPTNNTAPDTPRYKPNYSYLRNKFGTTEGQVARCNKRHFTDQQRKCMTFKAFVDLWEADDGKESLYYLKDCHLARTFPQDEFYTVPDIFRDDWLNEYWTQTGNDDYKFTYMGGDTTFTPLHADVYRSYSWSSNICGIKKWTFFPPGQEELLKDKFGNLVYDIRVVDKTDFPLFHTAKRIVVYQKDGETVFVPSGWFHQVENIGAAISINHNWSNACNLMYTYKSLKKDYNDCLRAIQDIKDGMSAIEFTEETQKLLLIHSGWDWKTFLNILHRIVHNRVVVEDSSLIQPYQPSLARQMEQIKAVLNQWLQDEGDDLLDYFKNNGDGSLYLKYTELNMYINKLI
ncbi:hypothetical protein EDC94DRAFT_567180 [Helicostylum pulchrum]|nr:hypothetical protein EDC94DRAFT_567180 [Helicostylum pulchrum]